MVCLCGEEGWRGFSIVVLTTHGDARDVDPCVKYAMMDVFLLTGALLMLGSLTRRTATPLQVRTRFCAQTDVLRCKLDGNSIFYCYNCNGVGRLSACYAVWIESAHGSLDASPVDRPYL